MGEAAAFERRCDGSRLLVALNAGEDPVRLPVDLDAGVARPEPLPLPGWQPAALDIGAEGGIEVPLAARSGGIWRLP